MHWWYIKWDVVNGSKCLSVRANLLKVILVFHNKWLSYNLYIISTVSIKDTKYTHKSILPLNTIHSVIFVDGVEWIHCKKAVQTPRYETLEAILKDTLQWVYLLYGVYKTLFILKCLVY